MIARAIAALGALAGLTSASAAPDSRDVAEGLLHALGGDGVPVQAIEISGCERVEGQPGYVCTYSINECTAANLPPGECDDPGVDERAIFVGGDNGWLAIDIGPAEGPEPRIGLDPSSPLLHEVSEQWVAGSWNPEGNCANDAGFRLEPGGAYYAGTAEGRWSLDGSELTITILREGGEGAPFEPIAEPFEMRWQILNLGPHVGQLTYEDGARATIIRC